MQYVIKIKRITYDFYTSNIWLMGIPFFSLGMICKCPIHNKINKNYLILLFWLGISISLLQRYLLYPSDLYIGTILSAYSAFLYCLKRTSSKMTILAKVGKLYSKNIYITHLLMLMFFNTYEKYFQAPFIWLYIKPILLCIVTTIFAIICHFIKLFGN